MWAYPQTNLVSFHTLSSSCLSLCLFLISRRNRGERPQAAIEDSRVREGRRSGSANGGQKKGEGIMDEALSCMPIVLQRPDKGDEEMDQKVWEGLPDELQDRVLACLPVPVLLQMRLVCKRWSGVITSSAFTKLRAEAPHSLPHFLVFEFQKPERAAAYNPWLHKWYVCPAQMPPSILEGVVISVCANGGLLCVVLRSTWLGGPTRVLLCNPVTRSYKELPKTSVETRLTALRQEWLPKLVSLVVDPISKSFKVIAAGLEGCSHRNDCSCRVTEVYDSVTNKWEVAGMLPRMISYDADHRSRTDAVCEGNLYCLGFCNLEGDSAMLVFNLKLRKWSECNVSMPHLSRFQVLLFERRGVLMLVQQDDQFGKLPLVFTWSPSSNAHDWTKLPTSLPREGKKFGELFDEDLLWVGQDDLLFFVSSKSDRAMIYDICRMFWTITPASKFLRTHTSTSVLPLPFDFDLQMQSVESTSGQPWLRY